jgi:N-acetyltransferase
MVSTPKQRVFSPQDGVDIATFSRRKRAKHESASTSGPTNKMKLQGLKSSMGDMPPAAECRVEPLTTNLPSTSSTKKKLTQTFLDLGQKNFHLKQCSECGFVYTPGKKEEDQLHVAHHDQVLGTRVIKFKGAPPGSTILAKDGVLGAIYMIRGAYSGANGVHRGHPVIVEVSEMLERELGACRGWSRGVDIIMYMYLNTSRELLGCVILDANPVKAYRVCMSGSIRSEEESVITKNNTSKKKTASCAVRVMWASKMHRRKKIVTKLLDCARGQLVPGQIIPRKDVAFSQPTQDGARFIMNYTDCSAFLVYE